jgi:hypothetical protein
VAAQEPKALLFPFFSPSSFHTISSFGFRMVSHGFELSKLIPEQTMPNHAKPRPNASKGFPELPLQQSCVEGAVQAVVLNDFVPFRQHQVRAADESIRDSCLLKKHKRISACCVHTRCVLCHGTEAAGVSMPPGDRGGRGRV